jgi:simple sugar transport system ATP-binding protein
LTEIQQVSDEDNVPLLTLRGITRKFGTFTALDAVSFSVRAGKVHALLGENGAGKTTLMRVAFGLIRPDTGEILVDGTHRRFNSPGDAIAAGIGMVHQQFSLIPAMTVAENVALGGRGRLSMRSLHDELDDLGNRTGLKLNPTTRVAELGPADRQKLEILRTFAHKARILILDEPTAVLTERDISELFAQIRSYAADGNGVVLITHKLRDALEHADFITVLRKGKVVYSSPAAETDERTLAEAMVGVSTIHDMAAMQPGTEEPRTLTAAFNIEIRRGEILGVAALEGAAKKLISHLSRFSGAESQTLRVGFVPENRRDDALIDDFSLVENLALSNAAARTGVIDWSEVEAATRSVIQEFNVKTTGVHAAAKELSGGNQQRFVLGRELNDAPDLLVLENPTQGLDLNAAAFVHEQMRQAALRGAAVVFYSSDLDELAANSDRVVVISPGATASVAPNRDEIANALLAS